MAKRRNILLVTAVLIAATLALSYVRIFNWPFGASVTLVSMIPLLIIGYKYGVKWGLFSGLMTGVIKLGLDIAFVHPFAGSYDASHIAGATAQAAVVIILDYVIAYFVLGFSGLFRDRINSDRFAMILGSGFAVILRHVAHFVSRFLLYGKNAKVYLLEIKNSFAGSFLEGSKLADFMSSFSDTIINSTTGNYRGELYAFAYTTAYMLPEFVLTLVVLLVMMLIPPVEDHIVNE